MFRIIVHTTIGVCIFFNAIVEYFLLELNIQVGRQV